MHIPVPNVIVENKAEHVALPNEIYEHMYFVSGTDFLFFHVIYIYIHTYTDTYIYTYSIFQHMFILCFIMYHVSTLAEPFSQFPRLTWMQCNGFTDLTTNETNMQFGAFQNRPCGVCHNHLKQPLKIWTNPASPRDNTCLF